MRGFACEKSPGARAPWHQTVGGGRIGGRTCQNIGCVLRAHMAVNIAPLARRRERDGASHCHKPRDIQPTRISTPSGQSSALSACNKCVPRRVSSPGSGSAPRQVVHTLKIAVIAPFPPVSHRGKGQRESRITNDQSHPSGRRNTPSARNQQRWQVSRLADTGDRPTDTRLPNPFGSVARVTSSGHGRAGAAALEAHDPIDRKPCRIPSSPALKTGTSAASECASTTVLSSTRTNPMPTLQTDSPESLACHNAKMAKKKGQHAIRSWRRKKAKKD